MAHTSGWAKIANLKQAVCLSFSGHNLANGTLRHWLFNITLLLWNRIWGIIDGKHNDTEGFYRHRTMLRLVRVVVLWLLSFTNHSFSFFAFTLFFFFFPPLSEWHLIPTILLFGWYIFKILYIINICIYYTIISWYASSWLGGHSFNQPHWIYEQWQWVPLECILFDISLQI